MSSGPSLPRTAVAWTVSSLATVGLTLPGMAIATIPALNIVTFRMARLWGRICIASTGCPVATHGLTNVDVNGRYVVMANHQSALDIPLLMSVLPAEWKTVVWAKKSLFRIPVLGWAMRTLGHMPIDRVDRSTAGETLFRSRRKISNSRSVLVFPEATYAPEGKPLPYKRGGFVLAIKTGLPILPVGVWGTRIALPPNGRLISPTAITVRFGAPIPTADVSVSDRAELTERARTVIDDLARPPRDG